MRVVAGVDVADAAERDRAVGLAAYVLLIARAARATEDAPYAAVGASCCSFDEDTVGLRTAGPDHLLRDIVTSRATKVLVLENGGRSGSIRAHRDDRLSLEGRDALEGGCGGECGCALERNGVLESGGSFDRQRIVTDADLTFIHGVGAQTQRLGGGGAARDDLATVGAARMQIIIARNRYRKDAGS